MPPRKGLYPPIFRIDVEATRSFFGDSVALQDLHRSIVDLYNEGKEAMTYRLEGETEHDGCSFAVYRNVTSRSKPSPWINFWAESGISIAAANSQTQHFICFAVVDDELYAHTGGHSVVVFERFIDVSFPIDVARRIAKPEVKRARSSQISGATLANDVNFRDPRRITYTESLENVWTALSGRVRSDLLADPGLQRVFGVKDKMRLEVSSYIKLGPRVPDPDKLIALIRWLALQAESELPENDEWAILDSIKVLNPRKRRDEIARLQAELAENIFVRNEYENLAISHTDASLFASASEFVVTLGNDELYRDEDRPEVSTIAGLVQPGPSVALPLLTDIHIRSASPDTDSNVGTADTLLAHLNGELRHEARTYFLLSGRWWEVDAHYLDLITRDLLGIVASLDLERSSVGMRQWQRSEDEGAFNATSVAGDLAINGDRVLTDNVELFDTLTVRGGRTYLLHVKKGFDVKIRDVRSQVINSVNLIENDVRGAEPIRLKRHHAALVRNGRTELDEAAFLELFEQPRTYVLAYGTSVKLTEESIDQFGSQVARMEVVTLAAQFRQVASAGQDTQLQIMWVPLVE